MNETELKAVAAHVVDELGADGAYQDLFRHLSALTFVKDGETGRYIGCNAAFALFAGKTRTEEIVGCTDAELFPSEAAASFCAVDRRVMAQDDPFIFVEHCETRGEMRDYQTAKYKICQNGRACLFGMSVDITESFRRRREQQADTEILRLFVGGTVNDATFREALAVMGRYLGASRVYMLRRRSDDTAASLFAEYCADPARALPAGFSVPAGREPGWDDTAETNVIFAPDVTDPETIARWGLNEALNARLDVRSLYVFKFPVQGRVWGALGVTYEGRSHVLGKSEHAFILSVVRMVRLVVERTMREIALAEERDRAVAAERAKSFFFSTVSHDIRTPLNAIIGFSQLLKLGYKDPAERDQALESILVSGKTLLQLINDVLDLSKLEAGRMEIQPDPTNCRRLIEEIVESFRVANRRKEVSILADVGPMPVLLIDPQRVRQILFNLVGNAVKFTERGSVTLRARYEDEALYLEVQDTGCGISPEDQHKIAQPYVQVGDKGRHGGTGLGLAICRQLVAAMHGEIELQSKLGVGTTFYVTFRGVKNGEAVRRARLSATQQMRVSIAAAGAFAKKHILVVDDSPVNLAVVTSMLQRMGVTRVEKACNGAVALAMLRAAAGPEPFDIVLTDLWMPEMDGEALVKEIRQDPLFARLLVYAVTADVEAQKDYARLGFTDVLLKPLTFEKLRGVFG